MPKSTHQLPYANDRGFCTAFRSRVGKLVRTVAPVTLMAKGETKCTRCCGNSVRDAPASLRANDRGFYPNHIQVPQSPFHTQSVEHHVKLVTEVSSRVSGFTNHHFEILNTVHSRRQMPKFDSKKMFPLLHENKNGFSK